eukprot:CAMPEP_0198133530 /NCGR_PEP_ID=MMETSP1442-20131203/59613_1 /TAXON_ID= /ORGANISM="Craspedostauros australis, Strain CCMP3328" /LENGTH=138 /DNA_ID=CAMNT_0043794653 /DNA_START=18 /DNA_END=434 /DNA_ORIENTATION=-
MKGYSDKNPWNCCTIAEWGYALTGSDSNPLSAGLKRKDHAHIPTIKLMPVVSNPPLPCANSDMQVLAVPDRPLQRPIMKRQKTAKGNDEAVPKSTDKKQPMIKEMMRTNRRPYVSAIFPQATDVRARPAMKAEASIPA